MYLSVHKINPSLTPLCSCHCVSVYSLQCPSLYPTSLLTHIVTTHCISARVSYILLVLVFHVFHHTHFPSVPVCDGSGYSVNHPLDNVVAAKTASCSSSQPLWNLQADLCLAGLHGVLPCVSHDSYSVCITCCDFCTDASRCEECAELGISMGVGKVLVMLSQSRSVWTHSP